MLADQADHVLGVDTHRDSQSAAALTADTAVVQGQITVAANERGYRRLLRWARENAQGRRAWAALTREHLAQPRQRGEREALRVLLATRHSAVRSKRAAITLMKGLLVSAAPSLRERLRGMSTKDQLARCARLRINPAQNSEQRATIIAIRASARRALALADEALELEREIQPIVARLAPVLLAEMGVGAIVAAQILCAYSHTGRIRSRSTRWSRATASLIRADRPASPQPLRRPPAQPSTTHDRALPYARRPPNPRLHSPSPSRRPHHPRNQAMPQALHSTTPPPAPPSLTTESRK
jgi:transposase